MGDQKTISESAKKGIFWQSLELFFGKGFGYIVQLVLARILFPEDFGLVGMAVFFTGFIQAMTSLGLGASLIQLPQSKVKSIHYQSVFWGSIVFNLIAYLLLYTLVTPFAVHFYGEPRLGDIIPIMALSSLINAFSLVPTVKLTKRLNFKELTKAEIIGTGISGSVAIFLAFLGFGVYAIVFKGVLLALVKVPLLWRKEKWIPAFQFDWKALKELLKNGVYDSFSRSLLFLTKNVDYLIIGKLLSASLLGVYTFAFLLTDTFRTHLMAIMNKVMFPVYGKIQNDLSLIKQYFLKVVKFNMLTIGPIMVFLAVFSHEIVSLIGGQKWIEAVLPIRFLSISALVHLFGGTNSAILKGMGKFSLDFKISIFKALLVYIPLIYLGAVYGGVLGVSIAILMNKVIGRLISHYIMNKVINVNNIEMFKDIKSFLYSTLIFLFISVPFVIFSPFLLFNTLIGLILLLLYYWLEFKLDKQFFMSIFKEILKIRKNQNFKVEGKSQIIKNIKTY